MKTLPAPRQEPWNPRRTHLPEDTAIPVWWFIIGALGVLALAVFWIAAARIRERRADAGRLVLEVREDQVPELAQECVDVFRVKLRKQISLDEPDAAAAALDDSLRHANLITTQTAFERPGHRGWFVLPMGAFLGELVKKNAGGSWIPAEGGGLALIIRNGEVEATLHPFDKILKQDWTGSPDDLIAYVRLAGDALNSSA